MKVQFMIEEPDKIEATIKITMSVKEWTELRDQLTDNYPSWKLSQMVTKVLSEAKKVYYAQDKDVIDG